MKKLLIILLIPLFGFKPYGHIEIQNYEIRAYDHGQYTVYKFPPISTKLGLEYNYKRFNVSADSNVFFNLKRQPKLAFYDFKFSYDMTPKIKIRITHRCIHTITGQSYANPRSMYGGFNKIGVYLD